MRLTRFKNSAVWVPITEVVSFEVDSLGSYTPLSAVPPLLKATLKASFCEPLLYLRRGSFDVINCTGMMTF